jgi:molybdenum cofactor guanylyltransferase
VAILAGGRARRLNGRDKSALLVGGRRILDRQLDTLRGWPGPILLVAAEPSRFDRFGLPVIADVLPGAGALGGIYTAVTAAPTRQTLVIACDMPFLHRQFLDQLAAWGRDVDAAIPRSVDGYQPLCASYSRTCAGPIRSRIEAGALKISDLLPVLRVREIAPWELRPHDPDGRLFFNINTPEDYARALTLLERE